MNNLTSGSVLFPDYKSKTKSIFCNAKIFLFILLIIISVNSLAQVAAVNPPTGGFNIEGTLKANTAVGDWVQGTGAGGFVLAPNVSGVWGPVDATKTKYVVDLYDNSGDLIFTGGSSFGDNPNNWKWSTGKPTAKCDINHALFHSTTSATNKWVILGGDRFAVTGTSYIDFEFSQGIFSRVANGNFTSVGPLGESLADFNGRTPGDFVLSMEYSNGGAVATVHYYVWEQVSNTYKFVEKTIPGGIVQAAFGATNGAATDVPFSAFGSTSYVPFSFVEAAVDIDAILSANCQSVTIKTIFVKTKASDSYSAALKDFVDPIPVDFTFGSASFNFPLASYCNVGTVTPSQPDEAGTFSSTTGLVFVSTTTGEVNLAASTPGTYTVTFTPTSGSCILPSETEITINPTPVIGNKSTTICSGTAFSVTPVNGVGGDIVPSGTTYTWTAPTISGAPGNITGGSAQATGQTSIGQTLTNTTNTQQTATYTVTPTAGECPGSTFTVTVYVNPKPAIAAKNATICSGTSFSVTPTNGVGGDIVPGGTTYSWSAPTISGAAGNITGGSGQSGQSSISQTLTNTTNAVHTATYTVTPSTTNCAGTAFTVTVTVNPKPTIAAKNVTICSGTSFSVVPVNNGDIVPAGTTYTWSAPDVTGGLTGGAGASNQTAVAGTLTNPTNTQQTATYTVTPSTTNCAGTAFTVTVNVDPKPTIAVKNTTICSGATFSVTPTNGGGDVVPAGTLYTWTAPVISGAPGNITGGSAQATGQILISQTLTNTTNSVQTATYTVTPTAGACVGSTFTVTVTVNPAITVSATYHAPACDEATFSVTVNNPTVGATYTIVDRNGQTMAQVKVGIVTTSSHLSDGTSFDFSNIPAGSGYIINADIGGTCPANAASCGDADPPAPGARVIASEVLTESAPTVKAYPNPFTDKVSFLVTSPEAAEGSLEIYNMTGQKIKSVYTGRFMAGSQIIELKIPVNKVAAYVYILKIGDKQITGKLVQAGR